MERPHSKRLPARALLVVVMVIMVIMAMLPRAAYVAAGAATDPTFSRPILDGAIYLDWAHGLVLGAGEPEGAFYHAPLYPHLLAAFLAVVGERFALLYLLQQGLAVAAAGLLGWVAHRLAGRTAAVATAALVLLYHPLLFFASRPVGETAAIFLAALALFALARDRGRGAWSLRSRGGAGVAAGLSALARPNLVLVAAAWTLADLVRGRWRGALTLAGGAALALLPVAARNLAASGHPVLISSNGGMTLYHGNGPGAQGVFTTPRGFSGNLARQRLEATGMARRATNRPLDPVEADRWWGRQALRARAKDPAGTVALLGRRIALLAGNSELSLDYAPSLDQNPWRFAAPVPFACLLGLGAAGVALRGFAGTGGWPLWSALVAAATTSVVFYVSSRYRLPMAVLLCVPAGVGAAALVGRAPATRGGRARRALAGCLAGGCVVMSVLLPTWGLAEATEAAGLANRAAAWRAAGDLAAAEADARAALARAPDLALGWFNLGVVLEARARGPEAEQAYRQALARDPDLVESAGNLASLLLRTGRSAEAVPILRAALVRRPDHEVGWTNLVVALAALGDRRGAQEAAREALRRGVPLDPGLQGAVGVEGAP